MTEASQMFTDGKAYERMMGRWSQRVGATFLDWLAVPRYQRWLDAGCGNGAFTEELIKQCHPASVMAIDPSEDQLAYARGRAGAKLATFQRGDAQSLPFEDNSFDVGVMALVIAFLPDPAKAIAELARVVRPGGAVATYMWDFKGGGMPLRPIYVAVKSLGIEPPQPPNPAAASEEAMQEVWAKAGLTNIESRVIRIQVAFDSFDDFCESNLVPVGPQGKFIQSMSPELRAQLRQRLQEQLPIAADGRIVYEAFSNAIKGRVPG